MSTKEKAVDKVFELQYLPLQTFKKGKDGRNEVYFEFLPVQNLNENVKEAENKAIQVKEKEGRVTIQGMVGLFSAEGKAKSRSSKLQAIPLKLGSCEKKLIQLPKVINAKKEYIDYLPIAPKVTPTETRKRLLKPTFGDLPPAYEDITAKHSHSPQDHKTRNKNSASLEQSVSYLNVQDAAEEVLRPRIKINRQFINAAVKSAFEATLTLTQPVPLNTTATSRRIFGSDSPHRQVGTGRVSTNSYTQVVPRSTGSSINRRFNNHQNGGNVSHGNHMQERNTPAHRNGGGGNTTQTSRNGGHRMINDQRATENPLADETQPVPDYTESEFHLNITNWIDNPNRNTYGAKINHNLEHLWLTHFGNDNVPLEYSGHEQTIVVDALGNRQPCISLAFRPTGDIGIEVAFTQLCVAIFSVPRGILGIFSRQELFGLSPVPGSLFEQIWAAVFMLTKLNEEKTKRADLADLATPRAEKSIPQWLLTIAYNLSMPVTMVIALYSAVRTLSALIPKEKLQSLLGYEAFTAFSMAGWKLLIPEIVAFGLEIMGWVHRKRRMREVDREVDTLKQNGRNLRICLESVVRFLESSNSADPSFWSELSKRIFTLKGAASQLIAHGRIFDTYKSISEEAGMHAGLDGLAALLCILTSIGVGVQMMEVTTTTVVAIGAAAGAAGAGVGIGVVTAETVAISAVLGPLAIGAGILAIGYGALSYMNWKTKKSAEEKYNVIKEIITVANQVDLTSTITYNMLTWAFVSRFARPNPEDDDEMAKWMEFRDDIFQGCGVDVNNFDHNNIPAFIRDRREQFTQYLSEHAVYSARLERAFK